MRRRSRRDRDRGQAQDACNTRFRALARGASYASQRAKCCPRGFPFLPSPTDHPPREDKQYQDPDPPARPPNHHPDGGLRDSGKSSRGAVEESRQEKG